MTRFSFCVEDDCWSQEVDSLVRERKAEMRKNEASRQNQSSRKGEEKPLHRELWADNLVVKHKGTGI